MVSAPINQLENAIGHVFQSRDLIDDALTHSSTGADKNYERLEFLGDRVLGLAVAQILFEKFPDEPEGDLAKRLSALVQGRFLAKIATDINLGAYVYFSDAERAAGGAENENILADVFESMIGALYLDAGFEKCHDLITHLWGDHIYDMKAPPVHPKTAVQEWAQARGLPLPLYEIIEQSGPDHAPVFDVQLHVEGHEPVMARGRSRQEAEKKAAKIFIAQVETEI